MTVELDYGDFDKWFEKESSGIFMNFMKSVAQVLDDLDNDVLGISDEFSESLLERATRDLKAEALDTIDILFQTCLP